VLLPNQWSLRPVGKQVELGDLPINVAVHPGGRFAAVLHSGDSAHEIVVVDIAAATVVSRTHIHETFYGLEFSKDGRRLFCSGAGDETIHMFKFQEGSLTNHHAIRLHDATLRAVPAGLALDGAGNLLFAANVWGNCVTRVDLVPHVKATDISLGTNVAALAVPPVAGSSDLDTEAANKRWEATLDKTGPDDAFPYACRLDEKRDRLYVSLWAQAAVAVIDLKSAKVVARWPTQEHPCEMALTGSGKLLFVANASRNTVTVLDTDSGKALETVWAALYPQAPPGSTPNSLALSPDEKLLFVANADNNLVAVFDVETPGKSRSLGFIPVGWYPTSVRVTPDGKHLLVANGKGLTSKANPLGPQPGIRSTSDPAVQSIARLQIVRLPGDHTHGTTAGWRTPTAYVGDNDLALGQVVEALSHSKFWPQTAIFVVEDDASSGPDHVDAHRTTAFVMSPYTKHGAVDSTLYSTSSMLRTMELILGLKPMSQFDAAATPMFNSFQATPDFAPYQALPANVDLSEQNGAHAWGGRIKMNFAREDAVDERVLDEVIWRSVRGPGSPMPAPVRAAFVFEHRGEKDED